MSVDVSRSEYLWLSQDQAKALAEAAHNGDENSFIQQFELIENALAAASDAAGNWATPEEIFKALRAGGIIGVGGISVALTEAIIAEQQSRTARAVAPPVTPEATFLVDFLSGITRLASLTSTIVGIVKAVIRLTSLDVDVLGFVMNASPDPLTYVLDGTGNNPYFENCKSATGPLGTVLPGRRQIADPETRELVDCVAITLWAISNDKGHTGAFASVLADMGKEVDNGTRYVGLGWGVPYSQGPTRTIIEPTEASDAAEFYNETSAGEHPFSFSDVGFSSIFTQKLSLGTITGRFVICYQGNWQGGLNAAASR